MRECRVVKIQPFRSLGFQADAVWSDIEQLCYARTNFRSVRADFRGGQDQTGVHVTNSVSSRMYPFQSFPEKDDRVGALPLRIGWWEQRADIGGGDRAKECVRDRMQEDVSVGVAAQAFVMS